MLTENRIASHAFFSLNKYQEMGKRSARKKELKKACKNINAFFNGYGLTSAITMLEKILEVAAGNHYWRKEPPFNVIYFTEHLTDLCEAAFIINKYKRYGRNSDGQLKKFDENLPNSLMHHLSVKQAANPYKAIRKFFDYRSQKQWKKIIRSLKEAALMNSSFMELAPGNIFVIRRKLSHLIESAWLIHRT